MTILHSEAIHSVLRYLVEDVERHDKAITITVQGEREELRKQNMDPDKVFAKRREEHAEALAAR
jgi:uncharacterized protein (UPF0212 family)